VNAFAKTSLIHETQERIADLARTRNVLRKDDPDLLRLEATLLDARRAARPGRFREAHRVYGPFANS
jgi:hypothetical protein